MLKAIADPTRLQIFRIIERAPAGEACVCDLADCLGFRQPTVSHHLKVMTEAGLLNRERRGTWAWYSVNYDGLNRVRAILIRRSARSRRRLSASCSPLWWAETSGYRDRGRAVAASGGPQQPGLIPSGVLVRPVVQYSSQIALGAQPDGG